MLIRLSKYLADAGACARRKAEEEILRGNVSVNGEFITQLGTKVDTERDDIRWLDQRVSHAKKHVYIMLHKPEGFVSTVKDEHNRPTIMALVADIDARLVPVGRLDYNTSGMLLMTNDGDLTYKLTHPKHEVQKTYIAKIAGKPTAEELRLFRRGLVIEHYKTSPAQIVILKQDETSTSVKITIGEGRNRQVRKMCQAIGHEVLSLKRIATGKLVLGNLEKGKYRHLTNDEVLYLKAL